MFATVRASLLYVGIVFSAGFVLGTLRTLVLEPRLGPTLATMLELPLILSVAWWACRIVLRRSTGLERRSRRLAMGWIAFGILLAAEFGLAVLAFGRSPAEQLYAYGRPAEALGLLGQVAFALFPAIQVQHPRATIPTGTRERAR